MRKVIAHYSRRKAIGPMVFCFTVAIATFYFSIWFDGGHILRYAEEKGYWLPFIFVGLVCAILTFLLGLTGMKRLFFDKATALWIEKDRLIYLHRWVLSAKCSDIEDIKFGTFGRAQHEAIILRMRGGGEKTIPTGALKESRDEIFSRLKNELGHC